MWDRAKKIVSDVAQGAYDFTHRNAKALGTVGAVGGAAIAYEPICWMGRKIWSTGRRLARVDDAMDKAEGPEQKRGKASQTPPSRQFKGRWMRVDPRAIEEARRGYSPYSAFMQREGSPYALAYRRAYPGEQPTFDPRDRLSEEDLQMIAMRRGWELSRRKSQ